MNRRSNKMSESNATYGLFLSRTVIYRTQRIIPRNNLTIEIMTYTVQDENSRKYFADNFAPKNYHDIISTVCLPVYIKAYKRRNNEPSYTLNVQKQDAGKGEHF